MVFREGAASAVPKNAPEMMGFSPCGSIYEIGSINGLSKRMRILFIGDIVGSPGRQIVRDRLADIVAQRQIDLVIANGENSASGFGITPRLAEELLGLGIEVLTGGNHSWDRKEITEFMPHEPRLLRPANFPDGNVGSGLYVGTAKNGIKYAVLNLQGRVFMTPIDDPFRKADSELAKVPPDVAFVFVDMHAETTSEKIAMGWYLDGRVTAIVGTHTHVTTADEHVLPGGTAYITDVGMSGPHGGVIGMDRGGIIKKFLNGLPARFEVASGDIQMNCVLIETDDEGPRNAAGRLRARSIERVRLRID
jgi:2',3'-cyclic-nucleotide 2'-phosphodiesterase